MERPEREYPRYAHEAVVTLITPGQAISGRTRNLSRGGLCATLAEELAVGAEIQVDIQLVFDLERHSEALRLPARIVWCTGIDEGYQIGVQFLALGAWMAECLTMFVRYLHEEAPAPAPEDPEDAPLDEDDPTSDEPEPPSLDDRFR